jgi:hypothetical protein
MHEWSGLIVSAWNGFWRGRPVAKAAMRADSVVMPPPGLEQHLVLGEAVEDLPLSSSSRSDPLKLSL